MSFTKIIKVTHNPSGNTKLYKNRLIAIDAIKQSEDPQLCNWEIKPELVWE